MTAQQIVSLGNLADPEAVDDRLRCECDADGGASRCHRLATQEDLRCDVCRETCLIARVNNEPWRHCQPATVFTELLGQP